MVDLKFTYHIRTVKVVTLFFFIFGCNVDKDNFLSENLELKRDVYATLGTILDNRDSMFSFNGLCAHRYDSVWIFPSYYSWDKIEGLLEGKKIEKYEGQLMVKENQDLFIFKRDNKLIHYFTLDSLYELADFKRYSFPINTRFKLLTFNTTDGKRGAYLLPVTAK